MSEPFEVSPKHKNDFIELITYQYGLGKKAVLKKIYKDGEIEVILLSDDDEKAFRKMIIENNFESSKLSTAGINYASDQIHEEWLFDDDSDFKKYANLSFDDDKFFNLSEFLECEHGFVELDICYVISRGFNFEGFAPHKALDVSSSTKDTDEESIIVNDEFRSYSKGEAQSKNNEPFEVSPIKKNDLIELISYEYRGGKKATLKKTYRDGAIEVLLESEADESSFRKMISEKLFDTSRLSNASLSYANDQTHEDWDFNEISDYKKYTSLSYDDDKYSNLAEYLENEFGFVELEISYVISQGFNCDGYILSEETDAASVNESLENKPKGGLINNENVNDKECKISSRLKSADEDEVILKINKGRLSLIVISFLLAIIIFMALKIILMDTSRSESSGPDNLKVGSEELPQINYDESYQIDTNDENYDIEPAEKVNESSRSSNSEADFGSVIKPVEDENKISAESKMQNVEKHLDVARSYFDRGYTLYQEGNISESISYFKLAIQNDPNNSLYEDALTQALNRKAEMSGR